MAWEVAQRLNKAKVPCDLITGQEREEIDGAKHRAVTVEMADVTSDYNCAVVDEIQVCLWSTPSIICHYYLIHWISFHMLAGCSCIANSVRSKELYLLEYMIIGVMILLPH